MLEIVSCCNVLLFGNPDKRQHVDEQSAMTTIAQNRNAFLRFLVQIVHWHLLANCSGSSHVDPQDPNLHPITHPLTAASHPRGGIPAGSFKALPVLDKLDLSSVRRFRKRA